jgi:hypothetical protein
MKNLPEVINITIKNENDSAQNYLVKIILITEQKNNYTFIVGPSNEEGDISITKAELIRRASTTLNLALMDYISLEECFSGEVQTTIMSSSDIDSAIEAYKIYGNENYPEGYRRMLESANKLELNNYEVTASVQLS